MRITCASLILLFLSSFHIYSNEILVRSYGVKLGIGMGSSIMSAQIKDLPALPTCCTEYTSDASFGMDFKLGLTYFVSLHSELEFLLSKNTNSVDIIELEEERFVLNNGNSTLGEFSYNFNTVINSYSAGLIYNWHFTRFVHTKVGMNYNIITSKTYDSREEIVKPEYRGKFENERRIRNESSGDMDFIDDSFLDLYFGLGFNIFFNKRKTSGLNIDIGYNYGLANLIKDENQFLKLHKFRVSFSIFYSSSYWLGSTPLKTAKDRLIED